jgi:hypothetical protein
MNARYNLACHSASFTLYLSTTSGNWIMSRNCGSARGPKQGRNAVDTYYEFPGGAADVSSAAMPLIKADQRQNLRDSGIRNIQPHHPRAKTLDDPSTEFRGMDEIIKGKLNAGWVARLPFLL